MVPPCAVVKVPATTLSVSPSTSVSLAFRLTVEVKVESSFTVMASSTATGASFTGVTPMFTVLVVVPPLPSSTVTVKLSGPL